MILTDWRDASDMEVAPLYAAERRRWSHALSWDTRESWTVVETGRRAGHVPGWIARDGMGRIIGWTFYVLHDRTLQIGGLVADRPATTRALLDAVLGSPEASLAQALSCFIFPGGDGAASALARLRFTVRHTLYLVRDLGDRIAPADEPTDVPRPWSDTDLPAAIRLLAAAYEGVPGADCFAPNGEQQEWAQYVGQLVTTPGCGRFAPVLSFCAGPAAGAARLDGLLMATRLSADTAHVAQLAVAPASRGRGMADRLLAASCAAARDAGATSMTLMVDEGNAAARALYARAGFRETARFLYGRRRARTRVAA